MSGPNEPTSGFGPVNLAREADFVLGAMAVSPSSREVAKGDWREALEPRVMQVLVALHQAQGAVVSRDDLIARCWEGRVVGEDAINRAIGRLRRLSEADGGASFEIETIARVGYRLKTGTSGTTPVPVQASMETTAPRSGVSRRWLLAGGAVLAATAGAGAFFALRRPALPAMDPKLAILLEQAKQAARAGNAEAGAQSAGMFERVTQIAPDVADGWGGMGAAYAYSAHAVPDRAEAFRLRAADAIRHARALDPHNAYAYSAEAMMLPFRGQWARKEAILREGLTYNPRSDELLIVMADLMNSVGRNTEAADFAARANAAATQPDPYLVWLSTQAYWCANRLSEADAIAAQGAALFPRQRSCWFTRIFLLMYTGRSDEALALLLNLDARPPGEPDDQFEAVAAVARALKSRTKADIEAAMAANLTLAHQGAGYAENTLGFAAALGQLDEAFMVADGLYLERGFKVGNLRFAAVQRTYTVAQDRRTRALFYPSGRQMQRDPRFARLIEEMGFTRYWKDAGVVPDFQKA